MQLLDGPVRQWHQDYDTRARDDDMPEPRAMNIALFIDDVSIANGPLLLIPGRRREGVYAAGHDLETTSRPLWTLDHETVTRLARGNGIVGPAGTGGSVLMFHCNPMHASPLDIGPFGRMIVCLLLCHAGYQRRRFARPGRQAHRDFTLIVPRADDCLLELVPRMAE